MDADIVARIERLERAVKSIAMLAWRAANPEPDSGNDPYYASTEWLEWQFRKDSFEESLGDDDAR